MFCWLSVVSWLWTVRGMNSIQLSEQHDTSEFLRRHIVVKMHMMHLCPSFLTISYEAHFLY